MAEPRMRAGDADRQRVVEKLGRHLGEGRLTVDEFDERVARAHAAVYLDELPPLLIDLPADLEPVQRTPDRRPARSADRAARAALAVMAGLLLAWSAVGLVYGAPPVFALLLLFVFLRHQRWRRRW